MAITDRKTAEAKFSSARSNLLAIVLLSLVNVVFAALELNFSFLFSAFFPLLSVYTGLALQESAGAPYLAISIVVAIVAIALYFVFWLLSKKHKFFMLLAMIYFSLDTIIVLGIMIFTVSFGVDMLINLAFHAWALIYLIGGVSAWAALSKLPPEEPPAETDAPQDPYAIPAQPETDVFVPEQFTIDQASPEQTSKDVNTESDD